MKGSLLKGKTGVLDVVLPNDRQTLTWNGDVKDREVAQKVFDAYVSSGFVLASVIDSPGKATQVRSWSQVEAREKKAGTVAVVISPMIAGG